MKLLYAAIALSLPALVQAEAGPGMSLRLNYERSCGAVEYGITFRSKHRLGDRNGELNEYNLGYVGVCYLPWSVWYWQLGGVHNSQWGDTAIAGFGLRRSIALTRRLSWEPGLELSWIWYGRPRQNEYFYGWLPKLHNSFVYTLPNRYVFWGAQGDKSHLVLSARMFPAGGDDYVTLWSVGIRHTF